MANDSITVKVRERSGCLTIMVWGVVCYFVYRAITAWLPSIYSEIEIFSYNRLNHIWPILLASTILCTIITTIFKTFDINGFTRFLRGLFSILAKAASMILCVWLIFNIAGLGNAHYLTKAVMNSEFIDENDINKESNGEWVLKVQNFLKEMQAEKKIKPKDEKTLFNTIYTFINKEIKAAPEFIGMIIGFFLLIFAIIIFVLILFLWFFIDLSPLILVPISGLILVFLISMVIRMVLSPIKNKILWKQLLSDPNEEDKILSEQINQMFSEKKANNEDVEEVASISMSINPIYSKEQLQAQLNHMTNPDQYPDPFS